MGLSWKVLETLTPVRILLLLKLPILLPLNYLQMLMVPLVILIFLLLHVQTWIYSRKAKITADFVPNGFEPIPAPTNELNSASEAAKSFLISKTNCPAHRRSQGSRPQLKCHQWQKCDKKTSCFFSFSFFKHFLLTTVINKNNDDQVHSIQFLTTILNVVYI